MRRKNRLPVKGKIGGKIINSSRSGRKNREGHDMGE
jgi:hypothetical protein